MTRSLRGGGGGAQGGRDPWGFGPEGARSRGMKSLGHWPNLLTHLVNNNRNNNNNNNNNNNDTIYSPYFKNIKSASYLFTLTRIIKIVLICIFIFIFKKGLSINLHDLGGLIRA